ncbi:hypothetical protein Tco_0255191 [Tanacetum coccineum]
MDAKEFIEDDVVDGQELTQDDDVDWFKEPNVKDAPEQNWFNEMVNVEKDPKEFDDLIGSTIDITKFAKNCLKKDKLTKEDLEGPAFALLKGNFRNNIELEYNLEQCYLALTEQIDWVNPEGGRYLEYLKTGIKEKKYAMSLTKSKAARYELKGLEEMIPKLWNSSKVKYDLNVALEIVVRRADQKEYIFNEADFPRLQLNDIEDMYLLYSQNKLHHLTGDVQSHLVNALRLFVQRIVIKKRVEGVQLGVESYQTKLNITMPQITCEFIEFKEPYTIVYEPRGMVYQNKRNQKILTRAYELYKFSDGTLKIVRDNLDSMLHNFELGYNNQGMSN